MNNPLRLELTVIDNVPFGDADNLRASHALTLSLPESLAENAPAWLSWSPGQFVMIRPVDWGHDILWARPLSIARVTSRGLVLFFQVIGNGTAKLALLEPKDKVIVWGPLGQGFTIEENTPTLLLAGGIGIVPFCGYMDKHNVRANLHMMFGHKQVIQRYPVESIAQHIEVDTYFEESPADLQIFLDDIAKAMAVFKEKNGLVLACGPLPFLKYIWTQAEKLQVRTQLSLENRMACGVGACLGCVAKTSMNWADKDKAGLPVQTCTSGPVFWSTDIVL